MSEYLVEEVRAEAHRHGDHVADMLTAYANLLERIKADERVVPFGWVTDDYRTDKSATTYDKTVADRWAAKGWPVTAIFTHPPAHAAQVDMHPKHGDMHDGCGGYWCDYVQAEYKKPGPITLHESNIVRYVKLGLMCDKCGVERPTAEPVAQADGMCNADNPARRCVCREEFGHRVCEPGAQGEAAQFPMTEQQVRQWIDACNHEPSRQVLRDYLRLREAQPRAVPEAPRTIYDQRVTMTRTVEAAAPRLYVALKNLLAAIEERSDRAGIESVTIQEANSALLAAAPSPGESA